MQTSHLNWLTDAPNFQFNVPDAFSLHMNGSEKICSVGAIGTHELHLRSHVHALLFRSKAIATQFVCSIDLHNESAPIHTIQ